MELRVFSAGLDDKNRNRLRSIVESHSRTRPHSVSELMPREVDVLSAVALGTTNVDIGSRLGITKGTVKSYLRDLMQKLDACTRFEAVEKARIFGILS